MPYRIVFRNGENGKNGEEIVIKASSTHYDKESKVMEFLDDKNLIVAYIPLDRVLYIKKAD